MPRSENQWVLTLVGAAPLRTFVEPARYLDALRFRRQYRIDNEEEPAAIDVLQCFDLNDGQSEKMFIIVPPNLPAS